MIHAQLSPDASQALNSQRRNSTITSLLIAILVISLLAIVLLIIGIAMPAKDHESPLVY